MSTWIKFEAPDGRRMCALVECAPFQTPHVGARIVEIVSLDAKDAKDAKDAEIERLTAERDALLEALRNLIACAEIDDGISGTLAAARAAITKAAGERGSSHEHTTSDDDD